MADFRQHDRSLVRRKRKRRTVKDTFLPIYDRSKKSIEEELNRFFQRTLTTKVA
jgi:hypothetical protein